MLIYSTVKPVLQTSQIKYYRTDIPVGVLGKEGPWERRGQIRRLNTEPQVRGGACVWGGVRSVYHYIVLHIDEARDRTQGWLRSRKWLIPGDSDHDLGVCSTHLWPFDSGKSRCGFPVVAVILLDLGLWSANSSGIS